MNFKSQDSTTELEYIQRKERFKEHIEFLTNSVKRKLAEASETKNENIRMILIKFSMETMERLDWWLRNI